MNVLDCIFVFANVSYSMYFQHIILVQSISWLCKPWGSDLFRNVIHSSTDVFAIHRWWGTFQTAPIVFVSPPCSLDGKYDPDTVECALLVEISEAVFQAVRPFAVNEVKPLNLCTLCVSLENWHRHWLCLCCSDSSKGGLSCISWYLCVHVAAPRTSAALLPGVSLEV